MPAKREVLPQSDCHLNSMQEEAVDEWDTAEERVNVGNPFNSVTCPWS